MMNCYVKGPNRRQNSGFEKKKDCQNYENKNPNTWA